MSSKYLLCYYCLGYTLTVLLYLSTISTASGPNRGDLVTPVTGNACGEIPSIQLGVDGNQEYAACCPGWLLQEGKCINAVRAATRKCRDSTCPKGRVCSPLVGEICICPKGRRGIRCSGNCPPDFYGWGCRKRCMCLFGEPCDPVSGTCDDDDDDGLDGSSTTVSNKLSNNTAGLCGTGCGLRGSIGCVCNTKTNKCECPGYAIALVVVSVLTWAAVGSVFLGYYLKRKGYVDPILGRYWRKFHGVDEGDDSGFNTDVDQPATNVSWWDYPPPVSERNSGEYPLLTPITIPADLLNISSYVTRISRDSLPRSTSHSSEEEGDYDVDEKVEVEEDDGQHDYLNIPEVRVEPESDGEDYSQPYEHLDQLSRHNSVHSQYEINTRKDSYDPSLIKRIWIGPEEQTREENSYVNESVLKWKRRFATRRTILSRQQRSFTRNRCPIAPLSASCSDVRGATANTTPIRTTNVNEKQKRKPTLKPKPEFIKLKMLMDIQKRKRRASYGRTREVKSCDSCLATHDERQMSFSDLDSMEAAATKDTGRQSNYERTRNHRLRLLRAALLKKGISVPESDSHKDRRHLLVRSEDDRFARDGVGGPYDPNDPIYENNLVMKHTRRKSRLHSFNSLV